MIANFSISEVVLTHLNERALLVGMAEPRLQKLMIDYFLTYTQNPDISSCISISFVRAFYSHNLKSQVTNYNFQSCLETKSQLMFYETFWIMSIKQASQTYVCSTKSAALARRMSFIAIYALRPAEYPESNRRLPSRPTLPEEFVRSAQVSLPQI
jgi:hypothetical protein